MDDFDRKIVTLAGAKQWLRDRVADGATCPCCTQFAKVYKRPITRSMAYSLILIDRHFQKDPVKAWLHVPSYLTRTSIVGAAIRGGDWAKLVHWGLLEEKPEIRKDGSPRAGYYKITERGSAFARGEIRIPKFVFIYASRVLNRPSPETISVQEALGAAFDYRALMARVE
jgi:hypothetical protein